MTHEEILAKLQGLTNAELNLVERLITTDTYRDIAEANSQSEFTIRNRARRVFRKFGIHNDNGAGNRLEFVLTLFTPRDLTAVRMRIEESRLQRMISV